MVNSVPSPLEYIFLKGILDMARFRGTLFGILVCLLAALDFFQTIGKFVSFSCVVCWLRCVVIFVVIKCNVNNDLDLYSPYKQCTIPYFPAFNSRFLYKIFRDRLKSDSARQHAYDNLVDILLLPLANRVLVLKHQKIALLDFLIYHTD